MGSGREQSGPRLLWIENKKTISMILSFVSGAVFIFCLWGAVLPDTAQGDFATLITKLGGWIWWLLLLSGIVLIVFGYIFYDYYKKEKRYNELMATDSKSEFIKNREELEETASALGPRFEDKVIEKAQELKID